MNQELKITNISIYPITKSDGRLRAKVRIVLNETLQLTGMKIYDGSNGLFVSYPIEVNQKGEKFHQIFHPVKKEFREYVEEEVLYEYSNVIKKVSK